MSDQMVSVAIYGDFSIDTYQVGDMFVADATAPSGEFFCSSVSASAQRAATGCIQMIDEYCDRGDDPYSYLRTPVR